MRNRALGDPNSLSNTTEKKGGNPERKKQTTLQITKVLYHIFYSEDRCFHKKRHKFPHNI